MNVMKHFARWSAGRRFSSSRHERSRKEKKARYIWAKNLMREYPECNYGEFYCDHVYDAEYPWVWVDFRFFHSTKRRYYAVAMVTAEYEAYCSAEDRAINEAYALYPHAEGETVEASNFRREWLLARTSELLEPTVVRPSIRLKDYGPVAVGMLATVNTPHIDEHVIRNFIMFFRSMKEPVSAGWEWYGEEIQVEPRRLQTPR